MTTARTGKIARLPKSIRDELNDRLANNEPGPKLLAWLNTHPDVQKILADQFAGRAITQQNLSEWRRGGYEEWLQFEEKRKLTLQMFEQAKTLAADGGAQKISDAFATIAAADFVCTTKTKLAECADTNQRLECLNNILRQISRLRRDDHRATRVSLQQQRWDHKVMLQKRADAAAFEAEERRQMLAYFQLQPEIQERAQKRGGSVQARDLAALLLEWEHNLKMGFLDRHSQEFALTAEELEELRPYREEMRADVQVPPNSEGRESEGRVPRVPNLPVPTQPEPASDASTHHSSQVTSHSPCHSPAPIALANDCTPEEFAARSTTPNATQPRPSRRCPSSPSHAPRTLENQEKPTKTTL